MNIHKILLLVVAMATVGIQAEDTQSGLLKPFFMSLGAGFSGWRSWKNFSSLRQLITNLDQTCDTLRRAYETKNPIRHPNLKSLNDLEWVEWRSAGEKFGADQRAGLCNIYKNLPKFGRYSLQALGWAVGATFLGMQATKDVSQETCKNWWRNHKPTVYSGN